jgi:DNA repair exonuclease SbcCD ATPase subunit
LIACLEASVPGPRFQVDSLTIEGFKAFGAPQEVVLSGKHCFLFGRNARGKSSIVEAIRWSLFGLERDSDVRNRFREAADCRVELRFRDTSGLWRLERRLRPGAVRSDQTIFKPDGTETTQREALPNLVRLGSTAGAVVFFSAQQASRVRAYADLTRFHEVLYAHLGLNDADRLRTDLARLLEEQIEIQRQRADDIQRAEDLLRMRLKEMAAHLEELLRIVPWELPEPPTKVLSDTRIAAFVAQLAADLNVQSDPTWPSTTALDNVEIWIREISTGRRDTLNNSLASAKQERDRLSTQIRDIHATNEQEQVERERATQLANRITELLGGISQSELDLQRVAARNRLNHQGQWVLACKAVLPVISQTLDKCPICDHPGQSVQLAEKVKRELENSESSQKEAAAQVERLDRLSLQVQALAKSRDAANRQADAIRDKRQLLTATLAKQISCSVEACVSTAEARLLELQARVESLQHEGDQIAAHVSTLAKRLKALRSELHYHHLRDEEQRVRNKLQIDLQPARDRLRDFDDFRSTLEELHKALSAEFDAAVDRALPRVSDQMTQTFQRLTDHPAFDLLRIDRADGPDKLVVRVGSTRAPVPLSRPEDVLNGGAYAALGLVPHLVFSGVHAGQAELNLLIVDDPSQSFDTTHVELLLDELHRASKHAQLLLATHEEERFRPILERLFARDTFTVIRVTDFRPDHGPTLQQG